MAGAGLREGTGEMTCLKVPFKRGKRRAIANFDRECLFHIEDAMGQSKNSLFSHLAYDKTDEAR